MMDIKLNTMIDRAKLIARQHQLTFTDGLLLLLLMKLERNE